MRVTGLARYHCIGAIARAAFAALNVANRGSRHAHEARVHTPVAHLCNPDPSGSSVQESGDAQGVYKFHSRPNGNGDIGNN
eukprot:5511854-Alexandrium_andersonii.AAC.1